MLKCRLLLLNRVFGGLVLLAVLAVLNGCGGGGGSSTPKSNADPAGYYDTTGTATVGDGSGGTLNITDLQGMVNGDRFIAISTAQDLVYDGTISGVTQNDFTASVSVYKSGAFLSTSSVSGTITQGSSITGTLNGAGQGNGTFNLTYALDNSKASAFTRVVSGASDLWGARVGGSVNLGSGLGFTVNDTGVVTGNYGPNDGLFNGCQVTSGNITPVPSSDLYTVTLTLTSCSTATLNTDYTGLAVSLTQTTADDNLLLVVSNPKSTIGAIFLRQSAF